MTLNNTIVEIDHRKYVSLHSYQYLSTINKVLIFITILSTTHIGGPPSWYNTLFGFVFRFHQNSNWTVVPTYQKQKTSYKYKKNLFDHIFFVHMIQHVHDSHMKHYYNKLYYCNLISLISKYNTISMICMCTEDLSVFVLHS